MEAENSYEMLSASWRIRKAGGTVSVLIQRPEDQESQLWKVQS